MMLMKKGGHRKNEDGNQKQNGHNNWMGVNEEGTARASRITIDETETERKSGAETDVDVERMDTTIE